MFRPVRELKIDDQEQVNDLCKGIWEGNDYVPDAFPRWVQSENAHVYGVFDDQRLLALSALEFVPETDIAWVEGLRVRDGYRQQGLATKVVEHIVEVARDHGAKTLWYVTGSLNEASQKVAEKAGFHLVVKAGYLRLETPYPAHPRPSPNFIPLTVSPERLFELIQKTPDLIDLEYIPLAWSFDYKTLDGIRRLGKKTEFKVIISETGEALALYFNRMVGEGTKRRAAYTVFATDRTAFCDVMSRIVDTVEAADIPRLAVFLGPRPKEWSKTLGYIDKEMENRMFLLYEHKL